MARLEVPVVCRGGSYRPEFYPCNTHYDCYPRVCKEELNRFFIIRVGQDYPSRLIFVFDTEKPEGYDYLAMFKNFRNVWNNLHQHPRQHRGNIVTYPEFDQFMNRHFRNNYVVYAWVEFPDEHENLYNSECMR
jgi:hypothetical protein